MSEYLRYVLQGTEILFGDKKLADKRNKTIDVKKELRMAKTARKSSMLQRSSNRIRNITTDALS